MVPVIVNAILNEHQLVIDIVAFVIKGDFHRSRLGEKQRGKILAGWVTRKMRTIAQYSIRDPNGPENQMMISEEPVGRNSMSTGAMRGPGSTKGSLRAGSTLGMTAQLNSLQLQQAQSSAIAEQVPGQNDQSNFHNPTIGMSELPGEQGSYYPPDMHDPNAYDQNDKTPTEARPNFLPPLGQQDHGLMDYSPIDRGGPFNNSHNHQNNSYDGPGDHNYQQQTYGNAQLPDILRPGEPSLTSQPQPFYSDSQPYDYQPSSAHPSDNNTPLYKPTSHQQQQQYQQHESSGKRWSFESAKSSERGGYGGGNNNGGGGLRVANRDSGESQDSWAREALAGMDFAGTGAAQSQGATLGQAPQGNK